MKRSHFIALVAASIAFLVMLPIALCLCGHALDPMTPNPNLASAAPNFQQWAGRDELGRSVLARVSLAAGLSLGAASFALLLALSLAMLLGGLAGWYHGQWPDRLISWVIALLHTIPFFLLVVVAAAIWRPGLFGAFLIVGLFVWAAPARLARAEFLRLRRAPHVTAARAMGFPASTIFLRQTLPVAFLPAFTAVLILTPELIGLDVGLGFFGLGAQPPTPTLGRLLYAGLSSLNSAPWLAVAPCAIVIALSVTAFGLARLWAKSIPTSTRA
ncbi:MAG: Glutathione transport system permease protein GsiD [Verrucomicrobiae bacterium]|nr:Glutathione transport system permease protein GsiD [Verrucomicrobiae bacterium]